MIDPTILKNCAKLLSVIGLVCDIVGVGFLAYEFSSGKILQIKWMKQRLATTDKVLKDIVDMYKSHWMSRGRPERAEQEIARTESEFQAIRARQLQEISDFEDNYEDRLWYALRKGFLLVVIGFLLQAIGAIIS